MLEARKLKTIGKEVYSLGYIDNPMEVAKKFSLADAKAVNKAVADKLAQWDSLSLEQQLKKLNFEAYDFLGGNYHNVQQKYPTWQVSQQAYVKQIGIVQDTRASRTIWIACLCVGIAASVISSAENFIASTRSCEVFASCKRSNFFSPIFFKTGS